MVQWLVNVLLLAKHSVIATKKLLMESLTYTMDESAIGILE